MFGLLSFGLLRLVHLRNLFGALFGGSLSLGGRFGKGRGERDLFGRQFRRSFSNVLCRRRSRRENGLLNLGGLLFGRIGIFWGFSDL